MIAIMLSIELLQVVQSVSVSVQKKEEDTYYYEAGMECCRQARDQMITR